ncbi:Prolyl oligopeptidase family protein [Chitinophaga sp. CF118]|uniref:alpha/beta hydrolase family protein n=1 Tax=Chitinophaga sp. CF118 TaxID=1884367 RepID=UPI0008EEBAD9|nr:prolyl oligopeptidase family serine peptidase [Chitinophaga sp. CF118]SFD20618.1 Prolyl oligopeptidase family protein [Chitinophaga sp. CF118]
MRLFNQITFFFLCLCYTQTRAQKKLVTNDSYLTWQYLYPDYNISNNGQYIWYRYGAPATGDFLVLQTTDGNNKHIFPQGFQPAFTDSNLIFRLPGDTLVIQAMNNTAPQFITDVISYTLAGNRLLMQTTNALIYEHKTIYQGAVDHYTLDQTGTQLAFTVNNTLKYYHTGMDSSILLQQHVTGPLRFSKDGTLLFFQRLRITDIPQSEIRIWHYNDYYLPTQQMPSTSTCMAIDLQQKKVTRLDSTGIQICDYGNKYVLAQNSLNSSEYYWNKSIISSLYLINTYNGARTMIRQNKKDLIILAKLSPDEKFITWYEDQYYCYEITTGIIRNIPEAIEIAQWLPEDSALLIYDTYNIWQVDPSKKRPPVKLTNSRTTISRMIFPGTITTFNTRNKYNNAAPCLYYFPQYPLDAFKPVKAKDTLLYLLQRMSDKESPNLFITNDFKSYTSITRFEPEKSYNWIQATLVNKGILYKPENFDPQKKYPLIFHYYEKSSDRLYLFRKPDLSPGDLNIPWYVSNGYLVFIPDIQRPSGHPGKGARSVLRAAKHLRRYPWVDPAKLGLQGHSFGGYITNYLITHSTLFAAAQASAGPADFISGYGAIKKQTGNTMQYLYERGQNNIGATLWQQPDLYIKNSPVFRADKITTPLLILHNEEDNSVPVAQSIELFTALRRLQKPAWMLQYNGEGHILINEQHKLDFSQRQQQFFDHYLKGKPAPEWMKVQ